MKHLEITYRQFRQLVRDADGPFSYCCLGFTLVCHPMVYLAINEPDFAKKVR